MLKSRAPSALKNAKVGTGGEGSTLATKKVRLTRIPHDSLLQGSSPGKNDRLISRGVSPMEEKSEDLKSPILTKSDDKVERVRTRRGTATRGPPRIILVKPTFAVTSLNEENNSEVIDSTIPFQDISVDDLVDEGEVSTISTEKSDSKKSIPITTQTRERKSRKVSVSPNTATESLPTVATACKTEKRGRKKKTQVESKDDGLVWYCNVCDLEHGKFGKTAISPFCKKCGWISPKVPTDGDCFFFSVWKTAMSIETDEFEKGRGMVPPLTVEEQRQAVSNQMTDDVMETYTVLAEANPEDSYLNFLRSQPIEKESLDDEMDGEEKKVSESVGVPLRTPVTAVRCSTRVRNKRKACIIEHDDDDQGLFEALCQIDEHPYHHMERECTALTAVIRDGEANTTSSSIGIETVVEDKEGEEEKEGEGEKQVEEEVMYANPVVGNLEEFKDYFLREGVEYGAEGCIWADEFAHKVIAELANLAIVFVDMERSAGSTPYRLLACSQLPTHLIILKRQGPVGHFSYICQSDGKACFSIDELPPIVKVLWEESIRRVAETQDYAAALRDRIYGTA